MAEKTEDPTPQRLRKAREQGDSPISHALTQSFVFVVAVALAPAAVGATLSRAAELVPEAIANPNARFSSLAFALDVLALSLPVVAAAACAAAAAGGVQAGGVLAWKKLGPDFGKLNPAQGLKSLVSRERLIGVVRALVAAALVVYLAAKLLLAFAPDMAASAGEPAKGAKVAAHLTKKLGWVAALVGLALGGVDLLVVRRGWIRRNRMSPDEVKREHKESEGDPELKAARHRAHQEMLASAAVAAVRSATVVVVNPTHLAAALDYDEESDEAPRVVAQGRGDLARRMIEAAHAYNVPVIRDVPLARALSELEVGDEIPEALYEAVAEILREAWAASEASAAAGEPERR